MRRHILLSSLAACVVAASCGLLRAQQKMEDTVTYEVKITNLTTGQPFSPPIAVAHSPSLHLWQKGKVASPELRKLAEEGMNADLAKMTMGKGTDVAAAGMDVHIMPGMSYTLRVRAKPGDVISVATMVAASNDAFTGVDSCPLDEQGMKMMKEMMTKEGMTDQMKPALKEEAMKEGMKPEMKGEMKGDMKGEMKGGMMGGPMMMMKDGVMTVEAMAMDAGTEENTEKSSDTAAPAMGMGHPATSPPQPIKIHEGIKGTGDLDKEKFGWSGPVARIEIRKVM